MREIATIRPKRSWRRCKKIFKGYLRLAETSSFWVRTKLEGNPGYDLRRGEVPNVLNPDAKPVAYGALDALCWVLGHEHNTKFQTNLDSINTRLTELGFVLRDSGRLPSR